MCGEQEPANVAEALSMLDRALGALATADAGSLPTPVQAHALRALERAEARHTAARAQFLAAFTAQDGYEDDGQGSARTWLRWQTRVTKAAAAGAVGWMRRLAAHPVIAAALTDGEISASWARAICGWSERLPEDMRGDADQILVAAAAGGAELADLAGLAQQMAEHARSGAPDADEDGFDDRRLVLDRTFQGAGRLTGDLTPGCAAAVSAVLEALAKPAGPEDLRTATQRRHDALEEACRRLIAAKMVPDRAGQPTQVQVHITLAQLRNLPGASEAEAAWRAAAAARGYGWLSGPDADAAACDATIAPIVTGHVDPAALDRMAEMFLAVHGQGGGPGDGRACGCHCGGCTCPARTPLPPETLARLRDSMLAMAADVLSGPGGLASWLRQSQLAGGPGAGPGLPLDVPLPLDAGEAEPCHPGPPAPRRGGPPPALRLPRLRPAVQRLPDPSPDPALSGRPDRAAQPGAVVHLPPPDRDPPLGLDPAAQTRWHDHRHQPTRPHPAQPRPTHSPPQPARPAGPPAEPSGLSHHTRPFLPPSRTLRIVRPAG